MNKFDNLKKGCLEFIKKMRVYPFCSYKYRIGDEGIENIYGLLRVVFILELFGELDKLDESEKNDWAKEINSFQTDEGYYWDSKWRMKYLHSPGHQQEYVFWHLTRECLWSLRALKRLPRYKFEFLENFLNPQFTYEWINHLAWQNAWLNSNKVLALATSLYYQKDWFKDDRTDEVFEKGVKPALDSLLDPKTGYWGTANGSLLLNGLGATIHILPIYFQQNWEIKYVKEAIDSTLFLQREDGYFCEGGNQCLDFDGAYLLYNLSQLSDYRRKDLELAAEKMIPAIEKMQNPDGGFKQTLQNISTTSISTLFGLLPPHKSDILSTWFYPLALALITKMIPDSEYKGNWKINVDILHQKIL